MIGKLGLAVNRRWIVAQSGGVKNQLAGWNTRSPLIRSAICLSALCGCTSVSFQQLEPNLTARKGSPAGAIYYMPKPYLLVAQLPNSAPVAAQANDPTPPPPNPQGSKGNSGDVSGFPKGLGGAGVKGGGEEEAPPPPVISGPSDQSFGGLSEGYMIKLVYLPDMSRPMSMSVRAGLGTASLKPTLQNGWMLTGFDATADSKTAEILASVAQVITAYKTPGKSAAGGAAGGGPSRPVLRPGLYEFVYDAVGRLSALCPVSFFDETGVVPNATPSCAR